MKNSNLKWTSMAMVAMMFAFITSCNNSQQEQSTAKEAENTEMAEGMEMNDMEGMDMGQENEMTVTADLAGEPAFLIDYIDIKNALVNDKYEQVKQAATDLQSSVEESELSEEQRMELKNNMSQLAEAGDIKAQRQAFAQLSQQLYEVVQNKKFTSKILFWQHCPMALDGQGANWLSYEEQVRNPFMGQKMPGCGSVAETIN
ncbi:MAG: DUF3347 domain-containing protein [Anditalea sp.]